MQGVGRRHPLGGQGEPQDHGEGLAIMGQQETKPRKEDKEGKRDAVFKKFMYQKRSSISYCRKDELYSRVFRDLVHLKRKRKLYISRFLLNQKPKYDRNNYKVIK